MRKLDDCTFQVGDNVVFEAFDDSALVLKIDGLHLVELNLTASTILKHTDGLSSVKEIAQIIAEEYGINDLQACQDVRSF